MSEELKPCRKCGSQNMEFMGGFSKGKYGIIICMRCYNVGSATESRDEAIKEWNTRPIEDALREENERMRNAIEEMRKEVLWCESNMYQVSLKKMVTRFLSLTQRALGSDKQ